MKILYAAQLSPNDSAQYRAWALERLGHCLTTINTLDYQPGSALLRKLVHRAQVGPWVSRINRDILLAAESGRPEIFWADKLLALQPHTLDRLRAMGIRTVSYMIDNAFGPRHGPRLAAVHERHTALRSACGGSATATSQTTGGGGRAMC